MGFSTRRGADLLIQKGLVKINGRKAELGDQVQNGDKVVVGKDSSPEKKKIYLAYYKPQGVVSHSPQQGETDISQALKRQDVFPIGRLDKNSYGLIILTNDGRITDRLLNPESPHEKEYLVKTFHPLRPSFEKHMAQGVDIGDYVTKPCKVTRVSENSFKIVLTEGKKHQIKRMCVALHQDVADLKRVRIMNIKLGNLKPNQFKPIEGKELETFLKLLGLDQTKNR